MTLKDKPYNETRKLHIKTIDIDLSGEKPHTVNAHFITTNWLGKENALFSTPWFPNRKAKLDDLVNVGIISDDEGQKLVHGDIETEALQKKADPWIQGS